MSRSSRAPRAARSSANACRAAKTTSPPRRSRPRSPVARLPSPYREAITLTELEGLTQKEAAEMRGTSVPAMKSRIQRGSRKDPRHVRRVLSDFRRLPRTRDRMRATGAPSTFPNTSSTLLTSFARVSGWRFVSAHRQSFSADTTQPETAGGTLANARRNIYENVVAAANTSTPSTTTRPGEILRWHT